MALFLTFAGGILGFFCALLALAFGAGFLPALLLWSATGIATLTLGLALSQFPGLHAAPAQA